MKATTQQTRERLEELARDHTCAERITEALDPADDRDAVTPHDILTTLRVDPALAVVTLDGAQDLLTYAPTDDGEAKYLVVVGEDDEKAEGSESDGEFVTVGRRRAGDLLRSGDVALGLTHETDSEYPTNATADVGGGSA